MSRDLPHITSAELRTLKALWKLGRATVREVREVLEPESGEAEPLAYTTVMTLMNQLAKKGALTVDRSREPFVYAPAVKREQVLRERMLTFLKTVFDGQAGELVLRLVEEAELSPDDLRRIEARIEQRERTDAAATPRAERGEEADK